MQAPGILLMAENVSVPIDGKTNLLLIAMRAPDREIESAIVEESSNVER